MGGHEPAAHVAELFKTTDDFRQETAFVFQTFRDGQCLDFRLPTMVDVFISGSYAGSMEIQIEFVCQRLLWRCKNLFSTGDDDIGGGIGRETVPCGAIMEGWARLPQFIRKHGLQFSDALWRRLWKRRFDRKPCATCILCLLRCQAGKFKVIKICCQACCGVERMNPNGERDGVFGGCLYIIQLPPIRNA